jgi:hypothetical protein
MDTPLYATYLFFLTFSEEPSLLFENIQYAGIGCPCRYTGIVQQENPLGPENLVALKHYYCLPMRISGRIYTFLPRLAATFSAFKRWEIQVWYFSGYSACKAPPDKPMDTVEKWL